ncbi:hypothetical protein C8R47DRAFT_261110 [Mycena vitilis]|nr:hypothetical protein C8R47DRAFT_261110 [Mycena vitilis]
MSQRRTLDTRSKRLDEVLTRGNRGHQPLLHPMSSHTVAILTKRCCDALLPVRSISSQFRAMSNKQMPKEPSYFVSSILRPTTRPGSTTACIQTTGYTCSSKNSSERFCSRARAPALVCACIPSSISSARHLGLLHSAHVAADGRRLLRWESHAVVILHVRRQCPTLDAPVMCLPPTPLPSSSSHSRDTFPSHPNRHILIPVLPKH